MVGGVEEEFTAVQELLTCMGTNVVYCGEVGTGQVNVVIHMSTQRVQEMFRDSLQLMPPENRHNENVIQGEQPAGL